MDKVDNAKKILKSDLESYPPVLDDPISDARTYRKILRYFFSCATEERNRADCKDWLYKLYDEQTDKEKDILTSKVDLLVNAIYDFYDYLKNERII